MLKQYIEKFTDMINNKNIKKPLIILFILIILFAGFKMSVIKINSNYAGVIPNSNGFENRVLHEGFNFIFPWNTVKEYSLSPKTVWLSKKDNNNSYNIKSNVEGKFINIDIDAHYTYHMSGEKVPDIFNKINSMEIKVIENYIQQQIIEISQLVISEYNLLNYYNNDNNRIEIQNKIQEKLITELKPLGIVIETFTFDDIRPDENIMKIVQLKTKVQEKLQYLWNSITSVI